MRWIIRLMVLALVFVVIAVGSILLLPSERIARIAADQIAQATGRKVEMTGETKVSFYPVLGISTGRTTVANADWSDKGPMFQADSFKVGVDPQALFGGAIRITGLEAVNPHILLQKDKSGRVNWELNVEGVTTTGAGTESAPAQSSQLALTLDRALITGAQLTYIDDQAGSTTQIKDVNFDMRWPSYTGEATIDASFRPAQEVVSITGRIARLDHLIDRGGVGSDGQGQHQGRCRRFHRQGEQPAAGGRTDQRRSVGQLAVHDFTRASGARPARGAWPGGIGSGGPVL